MSDFNIPLDEKGWSSHYNMAKLNDVVSIINEGGVQVWAEELNNICIGKSNCLEIGCGTGISSLWLAKNGKIVTAIDYTEASVELVKAAAEKLGIHNIEVVRCDATKKLPFGEKKFDYIFQAGLLEHFETEKQIELLRNWSIYGKHIISMIPNQASIPYMLGKQIMEENGSWKYGMEIPKHSMKEEFTLAGITVEKEYTIGAEWALKFLPKEHYIRVFFKKMESDGYNLEECMQGYLLVTIGRCD